MITITDAPKSKLNKANARDVALARKALRSMGADGQRIYAASLAGIHRSSSRLQQTEVEFAIAQDGLQHLFGRHPANGCMIAQAA